MLKHPAIVALAAAVSDLLALGPVPDDPDGPQAAIDEALMDKVVRCVDAAGAVVDDLSFDLFLSNSSFVRPATARSIRAYWSARARVAALFQNSICAAFPCPGLICHRRPLGL